MPVPKHLKHKPIIVVDNYNLTEKPLPYSFVSDAECLSIGKAQYGGGLEMSAKVFRKPNSTWSRQSEELPIHRAIDLTTLIVASMLNVTTSTVPISNLKEKVEGNQQQLQNLKDFYKNNQAALNPRLEELKRLINILIP